MHTLHLIVGHPDRSGSLRLWQNDTNGATLYLVLMCRLNINQSTIKKTDYISWIVAFGNLLVFADADVFHNTSGLIGMLYDAALKNPSIEQFRVPFSGERLETQLFNIL